MKTIIEAARELNDPKTAALVERFTSAETELFGVAFGKMMADVPWQECNQPTHTFRMRTPMPPVPAGWILQDPE